MADGDDEDEPTEDEAASIDGDGVDGLIVSMAGADAGRLTGVICVMAGYELDPVGAAGAVVRRPAEFAALTTAPAGRTIGG